MQAAAGVSRSELWSNKDAWVGVRIDLSPYMAERRFKALLTCLRLTAKPRTSFPDKFHDVRELQDDFNAHMLRRFFPGTLLCLDATTTHTSVPGYVDAKRKAHPPGSLYYALADAETSMIFKVELKEGHDRPLQLGPLPYAANGQAGGRLRRMTQNLKGKDHLVYVILDLCPVDALVDMAKDGIYAACMVKKKKKRGWPRLVPGSECEAFLKGQPVGELHCRRGTISDIAVNLFAVNHGRYIHQVLATYGCMVLMGDPVPCVTAARDTIHVNRNQVLHDFSNARHAVDDNASLRQAAVNSLEATWSSTRWEQRQLAFFVAVVEANSCLAFNHFFARGETLSMPDFRAQVYKGLLTDWRRKREGRAEHSGRGPGANQAESGRRAQAGESPQEHQRRV